MDRLTSMTVFAKVVSTGSFAQAARQLRLSPAAVSKHVRLLEEWLGARLLNRTTRQLSLTETGATFHERSLRVLDEMEDARASAAQAQARPRGLLRVSAPISFGGRHLGPLVAEYLARYPDVAMDLVLDDRMADIIEEGFDLAIRIGQLKDSSLIARRLAPSREVLCAAPAYLRRRGAPARLADLSEHDCLDYALRSSSGRWVFAAPDREISVKVAARLTATNGELLRQAALKGAGIILCPSFLVGDDLRAGRLQPLLPDVTPVARAIHAIYPSRRHLSAKVSSFVSLLAARFGEEPPWDAWRNAAPARPRKRG